VLAFIPDLLIGWAVMHLTDSGWTGFFYTLLVLQLIYFFFWLKTALWSWILFWLYGREQMALYLEKFFFEARFPVPNEYADNLEDYLSDVVIDEELDCDTRMRAAFENGTLNGFKLARRYSFLFQLTFASTLAIKRYRQKVASRPAAAR
jgi:hypothetical protein